MPRDATTHEHSKPLPQDAYRLIAALLEVAVRFVPPDRGEAQIRKWLRPRDAEIISENRMLAAAADAVLLSADLLLSQPTASGTTAFDRLARNRAGALQREAAAIAALRSAQFRLLRLEGNTQASEMRLRDAMSGESLRIVGAEMPPLIVGTALFGRVAILGDGRACFAGTVTPLDEAAFATARGHAAAAAQGVAAGARWAEAVYGHVVRHGTLDVPGLNRPAANFDGQDDLLDGDDGALFALGLAWAALTDAAPDAELLQRTRQSADLPTILSGLAAAVLARIAGEDAMAGGLERLLLVQLETVLRRERGGSGALTLDAVGRSLDDATSSGSMPPAARQLFATLRRRLAGSSGAGRPGDAALERLVQRIQGLRAKTVAQGCTEQETLAAAEKVAELLDRYGLSLGELDFRAQPCEGIGIQTDRRRLAPIDTCVPTIAAFFDCRVWLEHAKGTALRYVFFGLRADVLAAQYLYELVERAFETETIAFRASDLYARMAGERRSATNSFQIGLARGICDKLRTLQAARDAGRRSASGRDLVPVKAAMVEEELAKLGLDLKTRGVGGARRVLADAFREGKAAGQRFEFAAAIQAAA
jgi:hypothetical protein